MFQAGRHWRLIAVLRVRERFDSHKEAANWYCTQACPYQATAGSRRTRQSRTSGRCRITPRTDGIATAARAWRYPVFLATEPVFRELWQPPIVTEETMTDVFGRIPNTLNPPATPEDSVGRLMERGGVAL